MAKNAMFTDIGEGVKTINFDAYGGIEGFLALSSNGSNSLTQLLRRVNPWYAKAQDMTSLAVSELPFDILNERGDIIDSSADWQNVTGVMADPQDMLYKLASSLCSGAAYVIPTYTSRMVVNLQYCAPQTIQAQIDTNGLQYLTRTTAQGKSGRYYPAGLDDAPAGSFDGEMMYFWLPDSDVEIGPALSHPAGVAQLSVELLLAQDASLKILAERGFIPPTLMSVKGMPNIKDRADTELWYNRWIRGFSNQVAKLINAETMNLQKAGASIDEIASGYPPLTRQAIENIGTAYGIPAALYMSDAAFASELDGLIKVWYTTSVFIRIYHTIEKTFNTQLLERFGWRMKFKPETLDAFQAEEVDRSSAWATYVNAGADPIGAARMLGIEIPDGLTFEEIFPPKVEAPAPVAPPAEVVQTTDTVNLDADMVKDLNLWRQVAVKRHRQGLAPAVDWECKALPDTIADGVRDRLRAAITEADVLGAFEIRAVQVDPLVMLANELRLAREALNL